MDKKILILGGAGFIGLNIAKYLASISGNEISIVDNLFRLGGNTDSELNELIGNNNVKIIKADLTDNNSFEKLDSFYHHIYMLASIVGVDIVNKIPHEIIRINTKILLNTFDWLSKNKCEKLLFTSTSECYAGTIESFNWQIPTAEDVPLTINDIAHPRFTYALTKMLGESGFINYSKFYDFDCSIVRYHNVYGPRMGFKHVIPHLVERFINNENPFLMYGHNQTRSFNYIDDAVKGTLLTMEKGHNQSIYHIGDNREITIETLIKFIGELLGYNGKYKPAPTYPGSVDRRCPDINKAKDELNYSPRVDWQTGIEITVNWYSEFLQSNNNNYESYYNK